MRTGDIENISNDDVLPDPLIPKEMIRQRFHKVFQTLCSHKGMLGQLLVPSP